MTASSETRVLSIVDVSGIQRYIFGANRLRDNIGASQLVEQVMTNWLEEALPAPHNFTGATIGPETLDTHPSLRADVIASGGGNVVLLLRGNDTEDALTTARATVRRLSRWLLEQAPGLEIVVAHQPFDWQRDPIGGPDGVYQQLFAELDQAKRRAPASSPLLGLGVARECSSTGLPAVTRFDYAWGSDSGRSDIQPLSADARSKVDFQVITRADQRMRTVLGIDDSWRIPHELDDLGRSHGEESYIAVVHADGNRLGQRFQAVLGSHPTAAENRACLSALRALSQAVERAGREAFASTVQALLATMDAGDPQQDTPLGRLVRDLQPGMWGRRMLPLRPLIFGGDDLTLVCDGRLGLGLAARYLREFERTAAGLPGGPAHACAGVAVVKSHYPFARAYWLSEQLCKNAKDEVRADDQPALDWQFATTGISGNLKVLRKRIYGSRVGDLTMRPVALHNGTNSFGWRRWSNLTSLMGTFSSTRHWPTNKLAALREVLRNGTPAVGEWRVRFKDGALLPTLTVGADAGAQQALTTGGWSGERCGYFDAIEALDFFIELK
ncbi:MAG TPA: hypothetical protein VFS21_32215 [Roseiflexaceae bacterium]|nr:hypothetical protein [Roseiflexaceae bacterium]